MTKKALSRYRTLKNRHLKYGIGKISRNIEEYYTLECEIREYIRTLGGLSGKIMKMYYLDGMTCLGIGRRIGYSEGHVRRIKHGVTVRLEKE